MITVVYIMGPGQSGSTLLTFLLGSHPDIATVGEVAISPGTKTSREAFVCSCGSPYRDCEFWQRVTEEMNRRGWPFDIHEFDLAFDPPGRRLSNVLVRTSLRGPILEVGREIGLTIVPQARRELSRLLSRNAAFVETVAGLKECRTFLDSTKRPSRAVHLQRIKHFDVKVIHLIRDGRAFTWSAIKHGDRKVEQAAALWVAKHIESERARRYFATDHWIDVRHEDVCARPQEMLARLHAFIGVKSLPEVANFRTEQHILGNNRMRLKSTTEIVLDERWKADLTEAQLNTIELTLGDLNRRYGYNRL